MRPHGAAIGDLAGLQEAVGKTPKLGRLAIDSTIDRRVSDGRNASPSDGMGSDRADRAAPDGPLAEPNPLQHSGLHKTELSDVDRPPVAHLLLSEVTGAIELEAAATLDELKLDRYKRGEFVLAERARLPLRVEKENRGTRGRHVVGDCDGEKVAGSIDLVAPTAVDPVAVVKSNLIIEAWLGKLPPLNQIRKPARMGLRIASGGSLEICGTRNLANEIAQRGSLWETVEARLQTCVRRVETLCGD